MPEGIDFQIVYDTTQFVRASIDAVVHTLLEAVLLVVLVVVLFLLFGRGLLQGDGATDINADVKVETPTN